jgi:Outer membrane protein beta-barrel domain
MQTHTRWFALLTAVGVVAAGPVPATAQLGLKAGLSFATLSNAHPDWKTRTGFAAGIALPFGSGPVTLQPEALYVQKGVAANGAPANTVPKLAYLDVPVLLKLSLPTTLVTPMVYAGPEVSFRLSCTAGDVDCSNTFKSTDWGVTLGGGVRLGALTGLTVEGRYSWGLNDIHDVSAGVAARTRTFMLLVGIRM